MDCNYSIIATILVLSFAVSSSQFWGGYGFPGVYGGWGYAGPSYVDGIHTVANHHDVHSTIGNFANGGWSGYGQPPAYPGAYGPAAYPLPVAVPPLGPPIVGAPVVHYPAYSTYLASHVYPPSFNEMIGGWGHGLRGYGGLGYGPGGWGHGYRGW